MMEQKFDLERLRPSEYVCEPDPRSTMYVRIDQTNGTSRPIELADHHELISAYTLHAGVPQEIVLQFETARNVYLYAWFVYRFYPVAEHQCLACLELALRERLKEEIISLNEAGGCSFVSTNCGMPSACASPEKTVIGLLPGSCNRGAHPGPGPSPFRRTSVSARVASPQRLPSSN